MNDIPTVPTLFDGLSISKLKIRGASYAGIDAPLGKISVPTEFILGFGSRRWIVVVKEAYELDWKDERLPLGVKGTCPMPLASQVGNRCILKGRACVFADDRGVCDGKTAEASKVQEAP